MALPIDNAKLLEEVILCRAFGVCSPKLVEYLTAINEYAVAKKGYTDYSQKEDMLSHSMVNLMNVWSKFDPSKSSNPFAFYYVCAWGSFVNYWHRERCQEVLGIDYETYCKAAETGSY